MRIAFFVNSMATEKPNFTTTWLATEALRMGHEVWYIGAGDFAFDPDDMIRAHARAPRRKEHKSSEELLEDLQSDRARSERITVDDLDVLMLRNDPSLDLIERPWAFNTGIMFGQAVARRGVMVVNDPDGLSQAMNKLYFQQYPQEVRPLTLISRDRADIRHFIDDQGGNAVLKPLQGSGGHNVFLIRKEDHPNLNQMIDAVVRDGYAIVQEYLASAEKGDLRLFLLNGVPFVHKGKYAAMMRVSKSGDMRSNMHVGGEAAAAHVEENVLRIAELVRPKLIQDGMYFVGLDIIGDKLMEINVFSPGGLHSTKKLTRVNFPQLIIQDLERKVEYRQVYRTGFTNRQLAVY